MAAALTSTAFQYESNTSPDSTNSTAGGKTSANDLTTEKPIRISAIVTSPPVRYCVSRSAVFTEMWFFARNQTHRASITSMNANDKSCSALMSLP